MNHQLERAKALLDSEGYTCVVISEEKIFTSTQRGIAPLMQWLDTDVDLHDFSAADKVVGKAVAYLYVLLGVKEVYAGVISQPALDVFALHHIPIVYGALVPAIRNRTDTGFCPMESAVLEINDAGEAYTVLKEKMKQMAQSI